MKTVTCQVICTYKMKRNDVWSSSLKKIYKICNYMRFLFKKKKNFNVSMRKVERIEA